MSLPRTKQLRDLLEARLGREVRLAPAAPLSPTSWQLWFAIYVDERLATRAVLVADMAVAAHLGAADRLVPVGVATAAAAAKELPTVLEQGWRAVLHGCEGLFAPDDPTPRVHLYDVVAPGRPAPADVASLAAAPGRRLDLTVRVRGYGGGRLSLVSGR